MKSLVHNVLNLVQRLQNLVNGIAADNMEIFFYKLCDEITYPFLNFNGATIEV